jgi:hypothetical protein
MAEDRYEVVVEAEDRSPQWYDYGRKADHARDVYAAYCQRLYRSNSRITAVFLLKGGVVVASDNVDNRKR